MKVLLDAQLPRRLCRALTDAGWNCMHTLDLPNKNRTTDPEVAEFADQSSRVVVTKDEDFVVTHLTAGRPARLLLVSTGNISNDALVALFDSAHAEVEQGFVEGSFVELSRSAVVVHG